MSFLEKSAWVMTGALTLVGGAYIADVVSVYRETGAVPAPNIGLLMGATAVLIILAIVGHIIAALLRPSDANQPEDERDRLIEWKAGHTSAYVLGFAAIFGLGHYALFRDGNVLFQTVAIGLLLSQLAEYVLTIIYYRGRI